MSHPVDRSDSEGDNPTDRADDSEQTRSLPDAPSERTVVTPEERPRPSWGQPGPAEPSVTGSSVVPPSSDASSTPPSYGQSSYGQSSYGQPSYGQSPSQSPYGQPQYGQPQYGQPQYGQQHGESQQGQQYGQPGRPPYGDAGQQPQHGWSQPNPQYGGQPTDSQFGAQQGWQQPAWATPSPSQYGQDMGRHENQFARAYGEKPRTGLSITALVLGILTLLLCWAPIGSYAAIVLGVLALVFGFIGLRRAGRGMAIAGMTVGGIGLVVAILASIFYTNLFVDIVDVATTCADQVGRSDGPAFEQCVTDRSPEFDPFN